MGRYSHLSIGEREDIMVRWLAREGVSQIAREIGRDKSTVSREIARNGWVQRAGCRVRYRASTAQARADERRLACRRPRALRRPAERSLVASLILGRHWSPEQVAGRLRVERPADAVSASTIYRAVNDGDLDCELPGRQRVRRRLRHRGKRRHPKGTGDSRGKIRATHELCERPPEASDRSRVGDWEGDTVVGRAGGPCLVTQVDRKTGYLVGGRAAARSSAAVNEATERALSGEVVRTVTLDRGSEFAAASALQEAIGAPVYFCLPHHPWQRGTNENTNGLLREYFPKGTDLAAVSDADVAAAYDDLNHRPRKRLGWKCPWEAYHQQALHLL
ncbi:IS30 family transposase [Olsenella sp. YH-ols2223]|uniref:IS30 family transposase n=1 Tax=Olsenella absiana TaxID=3115222 RepID=A0ABU7RC39_9ACTN